jgi:hypothetical protein
LRTNHRECFIDPTGEGNTSQTGNPSSPNNPLNDRFDLIVDSVRRCHVAGANKLRDVFKKSIPLATPTAFTVNAGELSPWREKGIRFYPTKGWKFLASSPND